MKENTHNGFEYVDLGLPSGTLWATCNVGASKPQEYGLFFQWGNTIGYEDDDAKAHSTWETCPFNGGEIAYNEKTMLINKNRALNNNILRKAFDAAHAHMGGNWRMPRPEDFAELIDNTLFKTVKIDNTYATMLISKINHKRIFVPFSGYFGFNAHPSANCNGFLWSSSLCPKNFSIHAEAFCLQVTITSVRLARNTRMISLPIRGVLDGKYVN